jgi:Transposase DDE domain group 1
MHGMIPLPKQHARSDQGAHTTTDDDTALLFELPAVARKKVTAAFDGGRLSSDGGVLLLRGVERRLGRAERLAGCIVDRRDSSRIDHGIIEMLWLRMLLIAAGYEDADSRASNDRLGSRAAVGRSRQHGRSSFNCGRVVALATSRLRARSGPSDRLPSVTASDPKRHWHRAHP